MERNRERISPILRSKSKAAEGIGRVVGKKSDVVQSGRVIRTSKSDLNISIFDGCDVQTVINYTAFVKDYSKHGDYSLSTVDGQVLNVESKIGNCQEFYFKDLKAKK